MSSPVIVASRLLAEPREQHGRWNRCDVVTGAARGRRTGNHRDPIAKKDAGTDGSESLRLPRCKLRSTVSCVNVGLGGRPPERYTGYG